MIDDGEPASNDEKKWEGKQNIGEKKYKTFASVKEEFKAMERGRMNQFGSTSTFKGQPIPNMLDLTYSDDPRVREAMKHASSGNMNYDDFQGSKDDAEEDVGIYSPYYDFNHRLDKDIFRGKIPQSSEETGYFSDFDTGFKSFKIMTPSDILRGEKDLIVVSREEWGGLPPSKPPVPMKYPIKFIIVSMKSESSYCFSHEECMKQMREMQERYMREDGLSDHPYNFMIGHNGVLYEGRGWKSQSSPSIKSYPDIREGRLDVAFFGDYQRLADPVMSCTSATELMKHGVDNYMVDRFCDMLYFFEDEPPL